MYMRQDTSGCLVSTPRYIRCTLIYHLILNLDKGGTFIQRILPVSQRLLTSSWFLRECTYWC